MKETLSEFMASHAEPLKARMAEHLAMAGTATVAALLAGVALAMLTYRHAKLRRLLLSVAGILQTIPGIALLVIMMAALHRIGALPAIATLFLFALLPIVQNTLTALCSLPPSLAEAATGIGMTGWQRLRHVRLPLAMPGIVAGLRIAAVQVIGLTTLAAFIGAGGLGQFINRGLFLSETRLILLGAVPAAIMAVVIDQLISLIEFAVSHEHSAKQRRMAAITAVLVAAVLCGFTLAYVPRATAGKTTIVVGSKDFTEQLIVAEIVAEQIEAHTELTVERRFGLGGSTVLHQALRQGTVDIAVEYSGTALTAILHQPVPADRTQILPLLRQTYEQRFGLTWLDPLGFNNSYGLGVNAEDSHLAQVATISELMPLALQLRAAFDFEFAERPDGYAGLQKAYGLQFRETRDMHPDLLYKALAAHETDVISAYTTDGRLQTGHVRILRDDKEFFPPYEASILVSPTLLSAHPDLAQALKNLSGSLNNDRMRMLNAAVDSKQMSVEQAAHEALPKDIQ